MEILKLRLNTPFKPFLTGKAKAFDIDEPIHSFTFLIHQLSSKKCLRMIFAATNTVNEETAKAVCKNLGS